MNIRKEKEKEFFEQHLPVFKILGNDSPLFTIKTAFFQKGKTGRHIQLFESELNKDSDIFIEFCENVNDEKGVLTNIVPFDEQRPLFKYKYNPFYHEEYETKEGINYKGEPFVIYIIPVSELVAVLKDGTELPYNVYEKRKESGALKNEVEDLPRLQNSLFPDFEQEYSAKTELLNVEIADAPLSEITIRDLAAIMLMKPVSARPWLNDLIKQTKSEI